MSRQIQKIFKSESPKRKRRENITNPTLAAKFAILANFEDHDDTIFLFIFTKGHTTEDSYIFGA